MAYVCAAGLALVSLPAATLATPARVLNPPAPVITPPDRISALEARIIKLEQLLESQALADMFTRLEKLQAEAQRLNGESEVQAHELEGLKRRQRDAYIDIDNRLRRIEQELAAKPAEKETVLPVPPTPPAVPVPPVTSTPPATPEPAAKAADLSREQVMYQRALDALKGGRHDQAITDFQAFITHYPKSDFAGNAQYWLGEANYATRRYEIAVIHFKKVISDYPGNTKLADATLKLGFAHYEMGDREQARKILNDVVSRYPNTRVAQLAAERLQKIKGDGK